MVKDSAEMKITLNGLRPMLNSVDSPAFPSTAVHFMSRVKVVFNPMKDPCTVYMSPFFLKTNHSDSLNRILTEYLLIS